jgi:hypothetical protein
MHFPGVERVWLCSRSTSSGTAPLLLLLLLLLLLEHSSNQAQLCKLLTSAQK